MTKKLIFASLIASCFIISCSDDNTEISSIENSVSKQGTSNKLQSNYNSYNVLLGMNNLSPVEGVITVNL